MDEWFQSLLMFIGVILLGSSMLWVAWDVNNTNAEKTERLQSECIKAGGSYIQDVGCLIGVEVRR